MPISSYFLLSYFQQVIPKKRILGVLNVVEIATNNHYAVAIFATTPFTPDALRLPLFHNEEGIVIPEQYFMQMCYAFASTFKPNRIPKPGNLRKRSDVTISKCSS